MKEEKKQRVYKTVMLVILTAFITFMITAFSMYTYFSNNSEISLSNITDSIGSISTGNNTDLEKYLKRIKQTIDKYYLWNDDIDEEKLFDGAVEGYVAGLGDEYTEYIPADEMEEYTEEITGNFVGIGIYMVKDEATNRIKVLAPIKDSPAEKAGVLAGDFIIAVNDEEFTGDQLSIISTKIKGEEGSTVKLKILRGEEEKEFEIKREKIVVNPVEGKVLENNIGYIAFSSFDENTSEEFKKKYEELASQGITSLIVDLRNNGGGIVDEALEIADYFVEKDTVLLYEVDKNNNEEVEKAKDDVLINMPTIILTNENTASSSEILAGALKDLGKAKIVGTKTYGKGVIQSLLTLSDGSGIKITSEEYLTPNKTKINKVGIEPDETVELPETVTNVLRVDEKDDTQLQKAIEMLK